ncbi:MAG: hypothetical protein ACK4UJ_02695 [Leptonema sp. (in: bacteria)]
MKKFFRFLLYSLIFFSLALFFEKKTSLIQALHKFHNTNTKELVQEECNPQIDPDCTFDYKEINECDMQYEFCIQKCIEFEEECMDLCEKKYTECIEQ